MRSVNKVILIGNVTRDPEIRKTQSGQSVCTFGLATNREWVTSDSRRKASAEYHEVVAWARLADICENYVRKGKLLYIEGYLKTRSWDTPEGIRKFKTEVVVQDMIMLEKRKGEEGHGMDMAGMDQDAGYMEDYDMEMGDMGHTGGAHHDDGQAGEDQGQSSGSTGSVAYDDQSTSEDRQRKNLIDDDLGL